MPIDNNTVMSVFTPQNTHKCVFKANTCTHLNTHKCVFKANTCTHLNTRKCVFKANMCTCEYIATDKVKSNMLLYWSDTHKCMYRCTQTHTYTYTYTHTYTHTHTHTHTHLNISYHIYIHACKFPQRCIHTLKANTQEKDQYLVAWGG